MSRAIALALALSCTAPATAGLLDYFRLPASQPEVPANVAEARVKEYLTSVLGLKKVEVKHGHGPMTAAEEKALDPHIVSRLKKGATMVTAEVDVEGIPGLAVIAGRDANAAVWDPTKGFLGYVQLDTTLVFPSEADRAFSLTVHVIGEPALFGFAPEAGPMWKVTERYLQQNASAPMGGGMGQLNAGDPVPYVAQSGETAPESDEIPAWVVRGLTDLKWKKQKPVEMGLLVGLTRRPASTCVRLTHVAGTGPLGKQLWKDAHRLIEAEE